MMTAEVLLRMLEGFAAGVLGGIVALLVYRWRR